MPTRHPPRNSSIVVRLVVVMAGVIAVYGAASTFVTGVVVRDEVRDVLGKGNLAFAEYIAHYLHRELERGLRRSDVLAETLPREVLGQPDRFAEWFEREDRLPPFFQKGMVVLAPDDGRVMAESPVFPGRQELSFADREWFGRALQAGGTVISRPHRNRVTGEPSVVFATAVRDERGAPRAIIAASATLTHPDFFGELYHTRIGETGSVLVISPAAGVFVAATDPEMVLTPVPAPGVNGLHDEAMAGYRGTGTTRNAAGIGEVVGIASVEATGWFVVARVPESEGLQPAYHGERLSLLASALLALGLFLIVFVTLRRMLRPLRAAADSVRQMAADETSLSKLPIARHDEVGELAAGFNSLVDTIEERTARLESAKRELEASLAEVKQLSGLLPICSYCRKIRDDEGYWSQLEEYLMSRADVAFSHGICESCAREHFPDYVDDDDA